MTAKLVEDLFLADDLEAVGGGLVAEWIREAPSHEAVEEIRSGLLRMLSYLRDPDDHSWIDEDDRP